MFEKKYDIKKKGRCKIAQKIIPCGGWYIDENTLTFDENKVLSVTGGGSVGPQGPAGKAATIQIGSVTSGVAPAVTNSGTETDAVLDFVLQQGPQGPAGPSKQGAAVPDVSGSEVANAIETLNALLKSLRDAGLIANN